MTGPSHYRRALRAWWNDDVDHTWLLDFLRARGFMVPLRAVVSAVGVGMGLALVTMFFSDLTEPVALSYTVVTVLTVVAFLWPVYWMFFPWPSPRTSIALFVLIDISIGLGGLAHADPFAGLVTTPLFAVTGIYIMFFHGLRATVVHLVVAVIAIVGLALRLAFSDYPDAIALAISKTTISLLVTVFILPFAQFGFWLIRNSSVESLVDPLTTLANRRGLLHHVARLTESTGLPDPICVFVIDLDKFKGINDRHGHAMGDQVLVRTANQLRSVLRRQAFVARAGGEEFVVIDYLPADQAPTVGERLRAAIAAAGPPEVTASVGVVCGQPDSAEDFDQLLRKADEAMYMAKRDGGDRLAVAC